MNNIMKEMENHLAKYSSEIDDDDDDEQMVNFRNIEDDRNQAKVELRLLDIAWSGFGYLSWELREERQHLILEKQNPSNSIEKRKNISLSLQNIDEQLSLYLEISNKLINKASELRNKYWNDTEMDDFFKDYLEALSVLPTTNSYDPEEKSEKINNFSKSEKMNNFSTCRSIEEIKKQEEINKCKSFEKTKHEISSKSLIEPKYEAPWNDPEKEFGWSDVYNQVKKLKYDLETEKKEYFLSKDNKTLETSMEANGDKQGTPPRSGDRGIESKENSLSPLNSSNESKGSIGSGDSGISSDETSMRVDKKKRKLLLKGEEILEQLMETSYEKQDISPHSGGDDDDDDNNDGTDSLSTPQEKKNKTLDTPMETKDDKLSDAGGETGTDLGESLSLNEYRVDSKYIKNLEKEYDIQIQKTLLAFWKKRFFGSLDEYLIPGLEYFENK